MNYFSLFSGIGGFEYGIQQAYSSRNLRESKEKFRECQTDIQPQGNSPNSLRSNGNGWGIRPRCVGFSEIDKYTIQIYKKHFPNHKEYGDVTNIKWSDVSNFEFLCGGFPCQSFSIAGKRGGFLDTRGTLFFEIARAAQEKQPRFLFLENVKGLLSHDKGHTFGTILNTLDDLGYDLQWQVLNSKNFGVPQNRERVFIIGHLRTTPRPQIFPLQQTNAVHSKNDDRKLAKCLDSNYHKGWLDHGQRTMIAPYIRAEHHNTADVHFVGNFPKIRRLTPTECERLQGFPDGWTEGISDTQRYKCLGNAVTTNVISAIMEKILDLPPQV